MKAVLYRRYGSPEVLEYTDVPEPQIHKDQILVKVHAASVNPVDWKFRSGKPRIPFLRLPRIPGLDIAGELVRVGNAVSRFKTGDTLYGMLSAFSGGGCAAYAAVPERNAAIKPRNLTFEEAAAVPVAGLAALQALRDQGKIRSGHHVLINGASGGVGSFAVQIAKACGAKVTAVTSRKNADFVRGLGADDVIDYTSEDFTKTGSRFDIIFDPIANRSFAECKSVLNPKGVYITTLPSLAMIFPILTTPIIGGKQARLVNVRARASDLGILTEWIEAGKIRPRIDKTFPLSKTAEAQAYSETGHARGKIVIKVSE
ncbi:MAG: NAD(P)-dependent alcohol dehydrogenase [Nitrospirae bacterium]|nr:NAD(P)-dependent alcohol dehydrogenase [Nitrospirota bacterium]